MKKLLSAILALAIVIGLATAALGANPMSALSRPNRPIQATLNYNDLTEQEKVIWDYYDTVNVRDEEHPDGDWETRVSITAPSEQEERYAFSNNETNRELHMGIFNLESSRMVFIEQTETAPADQFYHEGAILETYLVGLDCTVFEADDVLTFNGINFDEVLLEYIDGTWYILENHSVSTEALELLDNESLTCDAIAYNRSNQAGISTHNPLISRPELLELVAESDKAVVSADAIAQKQLVLDPGPVVRATAPPMQDQTSNTQPANIYVLISGSVSIVTFDTYVKKTLQNEMGYSYSSIQGYVSGITEAQYNEGLKANAMAVKMFAWWCRAVYAKHKSEGAHVCNTTGCQVYSASASPITSVTNAVNNTRSTGIRTSAGWILFAQYLGTGNWTSAGNGHTGVLYQKGAYYLAKQGNTFKTILSYYYANVPTSIAAPYPAYPNTISRGALQFFTAG